MTPGFVANLLANDIIASEFEFKSRYYDLFQINSTGKGMNSFLPTATDWIVSLLVFNKDGFGIPTTVDMP